jgi:hypothetical protein
MGFAVLILGASGTGKSTSLRNFKKGEIGVLNVGKKPLPFRGKLDVANTADYELIEKTLMKNTYNAYAIDDSQFLMVYENFAHAYEKGYDKFTKMAVNFQELLNVIINGTSNDTIVYLLHHIDFDDMGRAKAKTIGKMLDQQLPIESAVPITLLTQTDSEKYTFITNGLPPAKSPLGMFEDKEIENDLRMVDETIRAYWELAPLRNVNDKPAAKAKEDK